MSDWISSRADDSRLWLDFSAISSMEIKQWNVMEGKFHVNWNKFSHFHQLTSDERFTWIYSILNFTHCSACDRRKLKRIRKTWNFLSLFCVMPIIVTSESSLVFRLNFSSFPRCLNKWSSNFSLIESLQSLLEKAETVPVATLARTTRTHEGLRAHFHVVFEKINSFPLLSLCLSLPIELMVCSTNCEW